MMYIGVYEGKYKYPSSVWRQNEGTFGVPVNVEHIK